MPDVWLPSPLVARVMATLVLLAPLGVVLGLFMPLGLRVVALLNAEGSTYVAWAWAVNGFCSVIGSVLTTMLSMTFGFRAVLVLGLVAYVVALTALWRLSAPAAAAPAGPGCAGRARSAFADVQGLGALSACADLEFDGLTLIEAAEAAALNVGVVDEDIVVAVTGDEPVTLFVVEELHGAGGHYETAFLETVYRPVDRDPKRLTGSARAATPSERFLLNNVGGHTRNLHRPVRPHRTTRRSPTP